MKPTKVQELVYSMITENTGKHFADSGDAYGRHWERNQKKSIEDFINEKSETYAFDGSYLYRTVSIFHALSQFDLDSICEKFNELNKNCQDWDGEIEGKHSIYGVSLKAVDYLKNNFEVKVKYTFNTYNHDSDFGQVLQISHLTIDEEDYYLVQIHNGCDVRGGYTDAKLFKVYEDTMMDFAIIEHFDSCSLIDELECGNVEVIYDYIDNNKTWDIDIVLNKLKEN